MTKLGLAQECNIKVKEKKCTVISLESADRKASGSSAATAGHMIICKEYLRVLKNNY